MTPLIITNYEPKKDSKGAKYALHYGYYATLLRFSDKTLQGLSINHWRVRENRLKSVVEITALF